MWCWKEISALTPKFFHTLCIHRASLQNESSHASSKEAFLIKNFPHSLHLKRLSLPESGSLTDSQESSHGQHPWRDWLLYNPWTHTTSCPLSCHVPSLDSQGASRSGVLSLVSSILHAFPMALLDHWFGPTGSPLKLFVLAVLGLRLPQTGMAQKW